MHLIDNDLHLYKVKIALEGYCEVLTRAKNTAEARQHVKKLFDEGHFIVESNIENFKVTSYCALAERMETEL